VGFFANLHVLHASACSAPLFFLSVELSQISAHVSNALPGTHDSADIAASAQP
jgi:hypothetical protein